MKYPVILGIETSCDETAAAVYQKDRGVLSNQIFSQINLHKIYGGVVPEIASRSHIEKIRPIVENALKTSQITLQDIDIIAVTQKPGLPGSLLIGIGFAKTIAWALKKPIIGINHLEGHIFSSFLENQVPFPHICLTASGGHTSLYLVHDFSNYEELGHTLDDAAGEAFDKIAKILGLGYPGGPILEKLAQEVAFKDFYHYPRGKTDSFYFSFSGLKTAVLYDLVNKNIYDLKTKTMHIDKLNHELIQKVASSLLVCINDIFITKLKLALAYYPTIQAITFVGGVACNKFIKNNIKNFAQEHNIEFFSPSAQYCTDNAAMIALVGSYKAQQGLFSDYKLDLA